MSDLLKHALKRYKTDEELRDAELKKSLNLPKIDAAAWEAAVPPKGWIMAGIRARLWMTIISVALSVAAASAPLQGQANDQDQKESIGLGELVAATKQAIVLLEREMPNGVAFVIGDAPYTFDSARLSVQLVTEAEGDAGFSFSVATVGAGAETARTQTVIVDLVPPQPGDVIRESAQATAQQLVALLRAVTDELTGALSGDPQLRARTVTVRAKFAVAVKTGGGFEFRFFGIGGEASAQRTESNAQELTLNFLRR